MPMLFHFLISLTVVDIFIPSIKVDTPVNAVNRALIPPPSQLSKVLTETVDNTLSELSVVP